MSKSELQDPGSDLRDSLERWAERMGCGLLVLFGSEAMGRASRGSDLDLAISFDPLPTVEDRLRIVGEIQDLCAPRSPDVVFLRPETEPVLRFEIFRNGETLYEREQGLFDGIGRLIRVDVPAAAFGTWIEGMSALWRLSSADARMADLRPAIEERLAIGAGLLARRQIDEGEARGYANPDRVRGAWLSAGLTRMDDQQHALSGLLYASDAIEGRSNRSPDVLLPGPAR